MDLGIWIIISALVGAKLLLLIVDCGHFTAAIRAELLSLVRSGGVFYGGLIARGRRWRSGTCGGTACRCGR